MTYSNSLDLLQRHLAFATQEINSHQWAEQTKIEMKDALERIRRRLDDGCANISVVGEFSSGKSSFLNALLGVDLLETDDMPDTTLVPAVLFYSPVPSFQIVRRNDHGVKQTMSLDEVRRRLREFSVPEPPQNADCTEDEEIARLFAQRERAARNVADVIQFNIGIPSDFLKRGFRLIDTPGLSSGNQKCADIAKDLMVRADASIIVAGANRGVLTQNLREQFSNFLGKKLAHCMVVFTRYDLITPSRREKVKLFLETDTRSYFNLRADQMPIFMTVPPTVSAHIRGERFGNEHDEMYRITSDALDSLKKIALSRRELTIANSLMTLFNSIYSNLESHLRYMRKHCLEKLKELQDSKSAPLEPFINKQKKIRISQLKIKNGELRIALDSVLDDEFKKLKARCDVKVFAEQTSAKALKEYINYQLSGFIIANVDDIIKFVFNYIMLFNDYIKSVQKEFESAIQKEFSKLSIIPIQFGIPELGKPVIDSELQESIKHIVSMADAQIKQDNKEIAGAVIGGIIGSIFTFGIGTAVGAAVGSMIGSDGKKSGIEGAREKVRPKYEEEVTKIFSLIRRRLMAIYDEMTGTYLDLYMQYINEYNQEYKAAIDKMIEKETRQQNAVRGVMSEIESELNEINNHKKEIEILCKTN